MLKGQGQLKQRQPSFNSVKELANRGLGQRVSASTAQPYYNASLSSTAAQIQLDATQVRAPLQGVVDERKVEIGDTVQVNQPLAVVC